MYCFRQRWVFWCRRSEKVSSITPKQIVFVCLWYCFYTSFHAHTGWTETNPSLCFMGLFMIINHSIPSVGKIHLRMRIYGKTRQEDFTESYHLFELNLQPDKQSMITYYDAIMLNIINWLLCKCSDAKAIPGIEGFTNIKGIIFLGNDFTTN